MQYIIVARLVLFKQGKFLIPDFVLCFVFRWRFETFFVYVIYVVWVLYTIILNITFYLNIL